MIKTFKIAASAVAVAAAMASTAHAAGFQLTEQSALGLGRSYAGIGVDGADLSGVYYNPATMTLHKGTAIQAGLVGIGMNLDYADHEKDEKDEYDQNGRNGRGYIPHGYIVHQINDKTWFGLAMTVPFGMSTEFDKNWIHADHGTDSEILSVDINPNFAFKLSEKISFGAGVSFQYVDASLGMGSNFDITTEKYSAGYLRNELEADNYAWGWNVGVMFTPVENVRIGLSYRSSIEHNARGTLTLSSTNAALGAGLGGSYASMTTVEAPAWAMLSAAWDINKDISLYATLRWADWSSFETVSTSAPDLESKLLGLITAGKLPPEAAVAFEKMKNIPNYWKDTYLMSIGGDWRVSDFWTLRGGIGYETSPIDQKKYRTAIIPDADRLWLSVGSTFHWSKNFQTDVAFTHLRGVHERSLYKDKGEDFGKFRKLDAWLVGVQAQYRF